MEFLYEYGLFLAKSATSVIAAVVVIGAFAALIAKAKSKSSDEGIEIEKINDRYQNLQDSLEANIIDKEDYKKQQKEKRKSEKRKKKQKAEPEQKKNIYVLHFDGDIKASEADLIRDEITAILTVATQEDEVVVLLESPGGVVHNYGLAASQLARIRDRKIPLTVAVDRVAASGGYMMACVANKVLAAPFAIIGSIGVVGQVPNFNKLLKKYNIDFEQHTAGNYKRTLTMLGENTDAGREKFKSELEETHVLFKQFITQYRPQVDIDGVATGEHWYGQQALDLKLVDEIITSDDYLLAQRNTANIFDISTSIKEGLGDKLSGFFQLKAKQLLRKVSGSL